MDSKLSFRLKSTLSEECSRFDNCFEEFKLSLQSINLNISQIDQIIKIVKHFLNDYNESTKLMLNKKIEQFSKNATNFHNYVISKLDSIETSAKRYLNSLNFLKSM